jgi:transcriptional regulator with XRE-family HTH domain
LASEKRQLSKAGGNIPDQLELQLKCGRFLREKRLHAHRTEQEVATYLDVPVDTVHAYENGTLGIPLTNVFALSNCLNIPLNEIVEAFHDLKTDHVTPFFEQRTVGNVRQPGMIIRAARETTGLDTSELVQALSDASYELSESELKSLERNEIVPSAEFWLRFCQKVHMPFEAIWRYSKWEHLSAIRKAIEENKLSIPVRSTLLQGFQEYDVALREHIELRQLIAQSDLPTC